MITGETEGDTTLYFVAGAWRSIRRWLMEDLSGLFLGSGRRRFFRDADDGLAVLALDRFAAHLFRYA
jgi:hypothetical protein